LSSTPSETIACLGGFYDKEPSTHAHANGVVLLGDAAHPMSPFRGEGANMAMLDAVSLADCLDQHEDHCIESALVTYEREMLGRSRKAVLLSRHAAREMHSRSRIIQLIRNTKLRLADRFMPRSDDTVPPETHISGDVLPARHSTFLDR
jgi:salicylate hydroxylase